MANESSPNDTRNVWQNQKAEGIPMSAEEIRRKIDQLDKKIRWRNFRGIAACILVIAFVVRWFVIFPNLVQRIGALLTLLGVGYLVYQICLNQIQKKESGIAAAKMGNAASVEFYRGELQRQRDFHCGIWFWSRLVMILPGPLVFCVGFEIAYPALATYIRWEIAAFLFFAALGVLLNLGRARKYQKQFAELDTTMKEQG